MKSWTELQCGRKTSEEGDCVLRKDKTFSNKYVGMYTIAQLRMFLFL